MRDVAHALIAGADNRTAQIGAALATITEMAGLVGDARRARAQVAVAALPEAQQHAVLANEETSGPAATRITAAVASLLEDVTGEATH